MATYTQSLAPTPCDNITAVSMDHMEKMGLSNSFSRRRKLDEYAAVDVGALLALECAHYLPGFDYLRHNEYFDGRGYKCVDEGDRRKICDWAYQVVDHFGFDREVVAIALSFLDRMCAATATRTNGPITNDYYQLTSMCSIYLAIKLHGMVDVNEGENPPRLPIKNLIGLSRGLFTIETLEAKEREILSTFKWHVNPPTTLCFISVLLRFLPDSWGYEEMDDHIANGIFEMARYLTEVSVCDSSFSFQYKASEIAYAAILCAMDATQHKLPFPYEARVAFQKKVAAATSLTPKTKGVRNVCFMFKKLEQYPHPKYDDLGMPLPTGGLSRSSSVGSEGGTTSPVCVCEPITNMVRDLKRTRLTYE